jgi:hypothetical protein
MMASQSKARAASGVLVGESGDGGRSSGNRPRKLLWRPPNAFARLARFASGR